MHDLLLTPIVFLLTAVLLVPLAQRLGLGSVLGYLIGGCLIGPWGLGLVKNVEAISHVAEIGVVLMLFLIGLELQPKKLLEMRTIVFGGGTLQMAVCGIVLALGIWFAGLPPVAALVAGLALSLSSTAIAVQSMQERHLDNTPAGKVAFAILLFQDMAAIPLLVLVPLLGPSSGDAGGFDWKLAIAAIVAVYLINRFAMRPALRLVARTRLREIFTAFSLLLVLGIAQLMTLANLSMGLGAFLAGVLLARSEYRKALETDLEPFKGLLLGLFFTSVGMSMNLGLLASAPLTVVALTVGYVALKMVALGLLVRILPVAAVQRWPFAALLAQGSEFAFVVFSVARDAKLLPEPWDDMLPLAVGLSMALTPLALMIGDRAAKMLHPVVQREHDVIEPAGARVIIAGFGRVGQIVGRMLYASGIKITVLDNDPDLLDTVRRFGFKVFYGDATRLDLLQSAGANEAILLVNAIDDVESNLRLTDLVRSHFPHLKMLCRARDVTHVFELRSRGVEMIERETFESALLIAEQALRQMGMDAQTAGLARSKFREHNIATLDAIFPHFRDETKQVSIARAAREALAESFRQDGIKINDDVVPD
ncbi:glutathione-regulated potassium-efflux system protein KefC [Noviherbaspirillum denitrificans]|uniref:Potassium transporter KefC n=1 Tax=Noviherbaspirillum denitrificans TaxID=1968433 RepID=A0A254TCZ5_9BURK|nr:glutathione-regulated potassium-efflux system protein KefC [Noviherbaspirillum denitrificans]OWW20519.1 potassium transporter KefC [Noviherbaspirillum denitrificans]